ncbi:Fur family transcriptional regulator [Vampirovibrio sp.]|uniref:Fur family transcriptional regulator n=1 Tax=Vampirovibrio sp. TaxID=2717857 RepID=UPI0035934CC5
MTTYTEQAIAILKSKGFRITRPRKLVLDLLDQSNIALSAYEIKDALDVAGEKIDTVSVYRILECLDEQGLIHRVMSSGKVKKCLLEAESDCQLHQKDHCHHLLICQQCNRIEETHCTGISAMVKKLEKQINFQIQSHHLEFMGLCQNCR